MCERTFPLPVTSSVPSGAARTGSSSAPRELLGSPETSSGIPNGHALTSRSRSCSNRSLGSDRQTQKRSDPSCKKRGRLTAFYLPDAERGLPPGWQCSSGFTRGTFLFFRGNKITHYRAVCLNLSSQLHQKDPEALQTAACSALGLGKGVDFMPGGRCWEPQDCRAAAGCAPSPGAGLLGQRGDEC